MQAFRQKSKLQLQQFLLFKVYKIQTFQILENFNSFRTDHKLTIASNKTAFKPSSVFK